MNEDFGAELPYHNSDLQKYLREISDGKDLPGHDKLQSEMADITDLLELSGTFFEISGSSLTHKACEKENELLEYIKNNKDALLSRALAGAVFYERREFSQAIAQFESYIRKEQELQDKNRLVGVQQVVLKLIMGCQLANKQYDSVEKTCTEYLAKYAPDDNTLMILGMSQYVKGNYVEAEKNFQSCLQLNPEHDIARQMLIIIQCKHDCQIIRENSIAFKVYQFFKKLF